MEQKLYDAALKLPETELDFSEIQEKPRRKVINIAWKRAVSVAACLVLLMGMGFGIYAYAAEVKAYNEAVEFFEENGLSTEGLSRSDIKAVYKDITTRSFTYSKTAEVIADSISTDRVGGYEILQETPTPEDVARLWDYSTETYMEFSPPQNGIHYRRYIEFGKYNDKYFIQQYEGDNLLWSIPVPSLTYGGYVVVFDGLMIYSGNTVKKVDINGNELWSKNIGGMFGDDIIKDVVADPEGTYTVFSHWKGVLSLTRYSADGEKIYSHQTEIGDRFVFNAARFGNGYRICLGNYSDKERNEVTILDYDGNITGSFICESEDSYYYINDMLEYNGKLYMSAHCVPKLEDESKNAGKRYEMAKVMNDLFDNNIWEITNEEFTPMVRENLTAILLVYDSEMGSPQEFYSVKGGIGGMLSLSTDGLLVWDVESVADAYYTPGSSFATVNATCCVYRYVFDPLGWIISCEKTSERTEHYW